MHEGLIKEAEALIESGDYNTHDVMKKLVEALPEAYDKGRQHQLADERDYRLYQYGAISEKEYERRTVARVNPYRKEQ